MESHRALSLACLRLLNGFLPAWDGMRHGRSGRKVRRRSEWAEDDPDPTGDLNRKTLG